MNKMELIKDNLAKIDKAIEAGVQAGDVYELRCLVDNRSRFILEVCSWPELQGCGERGPYYKCGDKETMAEINYQAKLNLAIEKVRKKSEVRHEELPAAIFGKHLGGRALTPCPNGLSPKVGSVWCRSLCSHFAENKGHAVYCRYPEKGQ